MYAYCLYVYRVVLIIVIVGFIVFIIVDVTVITKEPYNLMSVVGVVVYVLLLFVFSYSPAHVCIQNISSLN